MTEQRGDRFTELEERFEEYTVYDRDGDRIGKVDDLFVDENDRPEYIGVKMGFLGLRSTLIPMEMVRVDEARRRMEVSDTEEHVKDAPSFDDDEEITPVLEERVHDHFGLRRAEGGQRGGYGSYYEPDDHPSRSAAAGGVTGEERHSGRRREEDLPARERTGEAGPGMTMGDIEGGEFRPHGPGQEGPGEPESDLEDQDELRVQRVEEELEASTREREAGRVRIQKRVRTDREQIRVPKRREEVSVERVPVEGREAPEAEIGEDEVVMPVTEEEVVVDKRPVVKEEIRVRKDPVEEEELVEEDVRKEEVDVDDQTEHRGTRGGEAEHPLNDEARRRRER